jgi:hypothetical protein
MIDTRTLISLGFHSFLSRFVWQTLIAVNCSANSTKTSDTEKLSLIGSSHKFPHQHFAPGFKANLCLKILTPFLLVNRLLTLPTGPEQSIGRLSIDRHRSTQLFFVLQHMTKFAWKTVASRLTLFRCLHSIICIDKIVTLLLFVHDF